MYKCPECQNEMLKCTFPDHKGIAWWWCPICDNYRHSSELEAIKNEQLNLQDAQHAVDVLSSFDGPLPELTGALSEEQLCEQRLRDLTTITVPQTARQ